jgi:hypothetical protein
MASVWQRLQQLKAEFASARDLTGSYPTVVASESDGASTR